MMLKVVLPDKWLAMLFFLTIMITPDVHLEKVNVNIRREAGSDSRYCLNENNVQGISGNLMSVLISQLPAGRINILSAAAAKSCVYLISFEVIHELHDNRLFRF